VDEYSSILNLRGGKEQMPFAGIALVVLGVLMLLQTLNLFDFDYVVRYWPVLLIAAGAYLEYVAVSCCSPIFWEQKPDELAEWIEALGGDRLVLSSDLGQASAPPHAEGMRMLLRSLLDVGASADELEKMTKANPATLLGLSQ